MSRSEKIWIAIISLLLLAQIIGYFVVGIGR